MKYRPLLPLLLVVLAACGSDAGNGSKKDLPMKTNPSSVLPDFGDYPIPPGEIYHDQPAAPDSATNPLARRYGAMIERGMRRGVNFAGHYVFVEWSCGADCQQSVVVDAITGRVYPGPEGTYGYAFKADSRLLITNPPGARRNADSIPAEYWLWQTDGLRKMKVWKVVREEKKR